jgi:hypothetical protein
MHCHMLLYLAIRMLKVFMMLLRHDIPIDKHCHKEFK